MPPANLADGEYWTRVLVTSKGGTVPVQGADSLIGAGINLVLRTAISLTYRKGAVHTGVTITRFDAQVAHDSVIVWAGYDRSGNAAYLGTSIFEIRDRADVVVREWSNPTAVYYPYARRFAFPLDAVPAGEHTMHLRMTTEREDLDAVHILPADSVHSSVPITVPVS